VITNSPILSGAVLALISSMVIWHSYKNFRAILLEALAIDALTIIAVAMLLFYK